MNQIARASQPGFNHLISIGKVFEARAAGQANCGRPPGGKEH
jgi:hypothetical protein